MAKKKTLSAEILKDIVGDAARNIKIINSLREAIDDDDNLQYFLLQLVITFERVDYLAALCKQYMSIASRTIYYFDEERKDFFLADDNAKMKIANDFVDRVKNDRANVVASTVEEPAQ